jgi:hypothetical protein
VTIDSQACQCFARWSTGGELYKESIGKVVDALRGYSMCISGNEGHDDCSKEFFSLRLAQENFAAVVAKYETKCQEPD